TRAMPAIPCPAPSTRRQPQPRPLALSQHPASLLLLPPPLCLLRRLRGRRLWCLRRRCRHCRCHRSYRRSTLFRLLLLRPVRVALACLSCVDCVTLSAGLTFAFSLRSDTLSGRAAARARSSLHQSMKRCCASVFARFVVAGE